MCLFINEENIIKKSVKKMESYPVQKILERFQSAAVHVPSFGRVCVCVFRVFFL